LDLQLHTRSSLVARDTDMLVQLARENRVSISFSFASMDDRINRLVEPRAPSAMRRLAALEALARAGLEVGVVVSPLLPGLDARELGLEALLTRAANAGAHFAQLTFLELAPSLRESLLGYLAANSPPLSTRLRRVLGRRPPHPEEKRERWEAFRGVCGRLGLTAVDEGVAVPGATRALTPTQLALFA
jgi:DNA repair photolyase